MTTLEEKSTCKFCNVSYPATKEYFQVRNDILCLKQKCKECLKKYRHTYNIERRLPRTGIQKENNKYYMKAYNKLRSEKMKIYDAERRKKKKEAKLLLLSSDEVKTD
jgi:hypothetical protein